jgi:hypothetical protein
MVVVETGAQPSLRVLAAVLALAAGVVHLGQVDAHLEEGWPVAAFFAIVGLIQLAAAVLLLRPRPRGWFWFGIAGSTSVIAVWAVSRTVGLPFLEGGGLEPVGVAGGFASLAEAWTIIILGLYLARQMLRWRASLFSLAAALIVGLTAVWLAAAGAGAFNADPARLAAAQPHLVDWLVAAAGIALAAGLIIASRAPLRAGWLRGLQRGLGVATAVAAAALVWLTLPPTIGQNLDCRYAPLSTVLGGSHPAESERIVIGAGESRIFPIFELRACGSDQEVTLAAVEPATVIGDGAMVDGFWLLPVGTRVTAEGQRTLPPGARAVPPGDRIAAGQPRQLVIRVSGTGAGDYTLGSVRLSYLTVDPGAFTFATSLATCSGACLVN